MKCVFCNYAVAAVSCRDLIFLETRDLHLNPFMSSVMMKLAVVQVTFLSIAGVSI